MDKLIFSPLDITDIELNNKPEELSIENILNNDEDTESSLNNSEVFENVDTLEFQSFNSFIKFEPRRLISKNQRPFVALNFEYCLIWVNIYC